MADFEIDLGSTYTLLNGVLYATSPAGLGNFLMRSMLPHLRRRAHDRFASEGDSASGTWAPLAASTQRIRESGIKTGEWSGITPAHPINRRTGELERYITSGIGTLATTATQSTLAYPQATHPAHLQKKIQRAQQGDSRTKARPVLAVDQADLSFAVSKLFVYIQSGGTNV